MESPGPIKTARSDSKLTYSIFALIFFIEMDITAVIYERIMYFHVYVN